MEKRFSGLRRKVGVELSAPNCPQTSRVNQVLKLGDAYILRSGGSGGLGSPIERDLGMLEAGRSQRVHQP